MWVKEATCLLDSTANCTTTRQGRQLAALQSEALVWELRFADGHALFVCTLKVSTAAQAILQGAREWPEVLLSYMKSTFAAEAAHASALMCQGRSQAGHHSASLGEEPEALFCLQPGTSTCVGCCSLGSHRQGWRSHLSCTALTDAYGACPLHCVLKQCERQPENLPLAQPV